MLTVAVVQRSVGFGRGILFCRWLDAESLGHWEMAYGFLLLAAPLAVLGLPGSFGRYLTRYREEGRLWMFLRRTATWTFCLAGCAVAALLVFRQQFAQLVFGDPTSTGMMAAVAACLSTVILMHFLEAVFAGLRLFRIVSTMHFCQSMLFAAVALSLIQFRAADAVSVILAYSAGCLVTSLGVLAWASLRTEPTPDAAPQLSHRQFWPPLMRFAVWVWVTNLLSNLFAVVDRYMIVHCGGFAPDDALAQVGNYHASALVPMLLVSISNLLVGAMTPHLSHDWEAGRREQVSDQLNLTLKLGPLVMMVAGAVVLLFNPLLFELVFEGRYPNGQAVAPWTLATCVWFGMLLVAQTYVWCAEKSRRAAWPLAAGLTVNVVLNLVLLPRLGLLGAVVATAVATLIAFAIQIWVNHRVGMRVSIGLCLCGLSPLALAGGPRVAVSAIAVMTLGVVFTNLVINGQEKHLLASVARGYLARLPLHRTPPNPSVTT
ncbi:lipopolysaccharide biosynthesis protein [Posidoniimonas polymericola]|uniref:lipopolysaccharide biosynthesis protein n=1 Tax=Posidoniimonas polymericola TaxID=2528002 RepID=UPI0011B4B045|nr:lipopolysaccharide biosynthesis protein [Posidoniimonas polymericola]